MKNKGFTTIELIASFSVAMAILIILFNVILLLKNDYENIKTETNLLVSKDNLSYAINQKFASNTIKSVVRCEQKDNCYLFTYYDDTTDTLYYNKEDNIITFANYNFEINDDFIVSDISIKEAYNTLSSTLYNGYFIINIPIIYDDTDYSINAMYLFHTDNLTIII